MSDKIIERKELISIKPDRVFTTHLLEGEI